jgi:phosphopantothenoylcysteine decarboxylase/phosphopantothenate--cysteine ligase
MAAAVSDFRPADPERSKITKEGREGLVLELEPTADVLGGVAARRRPDQTLVGFAAEHGEGGLERARRKLERKALDAVVLNDVSKPGIGFDAEENEVVVLTRGGEYPVSREAKGAVAAAVLDRVEALRAATSTLGGRR